jgi:hypothetical protein
MTAVKVAQRSKHQKRSSISTSAFGKRPGHGAHPLDEELRGRAERPVLHGAAFKADWPSQIPGLRIPALAIARRRRA